MADLPLSSLSQPEQDIVTTLNTRVQSHAYRLQLLDSYYTGTFRVANLGVSVSPQFQNIRTVIGWPRVIIDSLDERLGVEGFLLGGGTDASMDLEDIWQASDMDTQSQLAHLDALIFGAAYITVGSPDSDADTDSPLITVESPLDLSCNWDARTRKMVSAFRAYRTNPIGPATQGTLYLPDETISLEMVGGSGDWTVTDRDQHNLGIVPVVRMTNRARINDRLGKSEITPEVIAITDAACRTLLSMSISQEFFAAPQRYILGAAESAFQDAEGNPKSAFETYTGLVLALEANPDGNIPTVGQFASSSPSAFTEVLDYYSRIITSLTGLPSAYLGITTVNPASADAIRMDTDRLITKTKRKQRSFEGAYEDAMRLALLVRDGSVPPDAQNLETMWADPAVPTPSSTSEAIFRQIQGGSIPATSDVTLERLGYSAVERQRLAIDRSEDIGAQFLAELATSLTAKEARVDKSLAGDVATGANVQGTPKVADAPVTPGVVVPPTPPVK